MTSKQSEGSKNAFTSFALKDSLLRAISEAGFETPRPIQADTISPALEGRDILGLAQTGTGKTAAFVLPILQRLLGGKSANPRALILAPTRELAAQIHAEIELLAKHTKAWSTTVFGGIKANAQIRALRRHPDIIVACPGRLLDLMGSKDVRLDGIEILVLDEADHMLDMGFLPDIKRILAQLPKQRQNLLFSATMPREIRSLADRLLHDPHVADCAHSAPITTIEHALYPVDQNQKTALLRHLIAGEDFSSAIVFLRTKHRAKRLARDLDRAGHRAIALQGNMSQGQRERAMKGFRDGTYDVLVATDIAARGIDVPKVSHVINFDIPNTPDAYTHRIGRTGRSEESGKACTFVTHEDFPAIKEIERKLKMQIQRIKVRDFQRDEIGATSTGDQRPRRGRRVGGFAGRQGKTNRNGRTVNRGARPTASAPAKPARPARNGAHSNNGRPAHPAPNFGAGIRGPARQNGTDPRG